MEGLFLLKEILREEDYVTNGYEKCFFSVPLHPDSQKFVKFDWKDHIHEFLCPCPKYVYKTNENSNISVDEVK